jgi:hypothetical protein
MKRTQFALFAALLLSAALSQVGCATMATHYQTRAALEREARLNVMRGGRALCMVDGETKLINDVTFWAMVRDNWPDYLKAAGLDFGICLAAYLIYRESKGDDVGDTFQTIYYPADDAPAGDDAGGDDDGGAE